MIEQEKTQEEMYQGQLEEYAAHNKQWEEQHEKEQQMIIRWEKVLDRLEVVLGLLEAQQ